MATNPDPAQFVAFAGTNLVARGELTEVALRCRERVVAGELARIALFDDATGRPLDLDLRGSETEVLARLDTNSRPPPAKRGPGRPRLGVVSREVSLLPRHWDWLAEQRGGASASLRRLVDAARKASSGESQSRQAIEAAHRFLWDIAGDLPGFEEASRALFAADFEALEARTTNWPAGIRDQLRRFTARVRQEPFAEDAGATA